MKNYTKRKSRIIFFVTRFDSGISTIFDEVRRLNMLDVAGFATDNLKKCKRMLDAKFLGHIDEVNQFANLADVFLICIGNNQARKRIFEKAIRAGLQPYSFVHSSCIVAQSAFLEKGVILFPRVVINGNVKIGKNVIVNTGTIIEHDNVIESHVNICPGVITCGRVKIQEGAYIGAGAVILPDITIGTYSVVGAGSVVTRDVLSNTTIKGVPAK